VFKPCCREAGALGVPCAHCAPPAPLEFDSEDEDLVPVDGDDASDEDDDGEQRSVDYPEDEEDVDDGPLPSASPPSSTSARWAYPSLGASVQLAPYQHARGTVAAAAARVWLLAQRARAATEPHLTLRVPRARAEELLDHEAWRDGEEAYVLMTEAGLEALMPLRWSSLQAMYGDERTWAAGGDLTPVSKRPVLAVVRVAIALADGGGGTVKF
jgi:hypothetical protein